MTMRRTPRPGPMSKGAGRVSCRRCGATAAADGKGSPIVLAHAPGCPEASPDAGKPWKAHCYMHVQDFKCETQAEAKKWAEDHWNEFGHHADYWLVSRGH